MIVRSARNEYLGAHVKPEVKDKLKQHAFELNISVSQLISDIVEAYFKSKTFRSFQRKDNESTSD